MRKIVLLLFLALAGIVQCAPPIQVTTTLKNTATGQIKPFVDGVILAPNTKYSLTTVADSRGQQTTVTVNFSVSNPSPAPTPTPTSTPSPSPSPPPITPTPTATSSPSPTPSLTPTPSPIPTPSPTGTPIVTPTPTSSPTPTPTPTPASITFIQPKPNGKDSYNLYYGTQSGVYAAPPLDGGTQGSWTITLKPGTIYFIADTARNITGESPKSTELIYSP